MGVLVWVCAFTESSPQSVMDTNKDDEKSLGVFGHQCSMLSATLPKNSGPGVRRVLCTMYIEQDGRRTTVVTSSLSRK